MTSTSALGQDMARRQALAAFHPQPARRVGLEVEWVVRASDDGLRRPGHGELADVLRADTGHGGRLTLEPGGQVELSTAAFVHLDEALHALSEEAGVVRSSLERAGLVGADEPIDLRRLPARVLDVGRYRAMEAFFDARGPSGRWMMCNTASVQVNLGYGPDPATAWRAANLLAPALVAIFANSPGHDAEGRGWASLRRAAWEGMDAGRTAPPGHDGDPVTAWRDYVLDADVMLVRDGGDVIPVAPGLSFRQWAAGALHRRPTEDDLRYHATTLFPPVRPRGWLEVRVLDALPPLARDVAATVTATALHPVVAPQVVRALTGLYDPAVALSVAARRGLSDDLLAEVALRVMDLVTRHVHLVTGRLDRVRLVRHYAREIVAARLQPHGRTVDDVLVTDDQPLLPDVGPPAEEAADAVTRTLTTVS